MKEILDGKNYPTHLNAKQKYMDLESMGYKKEHMIGNINRAKETE